jgi:hypothetical protein
LLGLALNHDPGSGSQVSGIAACTIALSSKNLKKEKRAPTPEKKKTLCNNGPNMD